MVTEMVPSRLVGAGYESFWSGHRLVEIWTAMGDPTNGIIQAHNGYIEIYLNLGIIGLVLLVASVASGLFKSIRRLKTDYAHAVLCVVYICVILAYNYTEAAFKPVNNLFVLLLFSIVQVATGATRERKKASEFFATSGIPNRTH